MEPPEALYDGGIYVAPAPKWQRTFTIIPRRCSETGEWIWLKYGYRRIEYGQDYGEPTAVWKWVSETGKVVRLLNGEDHE